MNNNYNIIGTGGGLLLMGSGPGTTGQHSLNIPANVKLSPGTQIAWQAPPNDPLGNLATGGVVVTPNSEGTSAQVIGKKPGWAMVIAAVPVANTQGSIDTIMIGFAWYILPALPTTGQGSIAPATENIGTSTNVI